jgi:hypothetical protein
MRFGAVIDRRYSKLPKRKKYDPLFFVTKCGFVGVFEEILSPPRRNTFLEGMIESSALDLVLRPREREKVAGGRMRVVG